MPIREIILGLSIVASFSIVYPVVKAPNKNITSYAFIVLVVCCASWLISSYLVDFIRLDSLRINLYLAVSASILGGLSILISSLLTALFVHDKLSKWLRILFSISLLLIIAGSVLPGSITHVVRISNETVNIEYGPLNMIWNIGLLITILILLTTTYKVFRSNKDRYRQMRVVISGVIISICIGLSTNLIVPTITGNYSSVVLAPLVAVTLSLSFAYAIANYRLFDLRTSVFRAVGYALSIATLVAVYSVLIYGAVLPIVSPTSKFEFSTLILITVGTAATIFFYDKVKIIFDTITDKLFFKNSYSLPKFLDEFNQSLITSTDIGDLADSIMKVMSRNLKTDFFVLIVKEGKFELTIDSRKKESLREVDAVIPISMINYHFKTGDRVVLKDYINKQHFEGLSSGLENMDMSAAIDLSEASKTTTSLKRALESGNFKTMLLGPKKSGENYNAQDLDALRIIAKELVIALQNAMRFEEIKLFNIELQHKIDLATIKLRQQNKKLVVADELKDDFLSIASHQMRTPISTILGYASILNSGDAGKLNSDQKKFTKVMETSTKRLSYLINDFLTVSRLKSGKFSVELGESDIKNVMADEVDNLKEQFKAKNIKLKVNIDNNLKKMKIDEQKIRQVMMNLIDNAMHYTKPEGQVEVTLKKDGNNAVFEVKDTGIGVPKEDQAELFSKMFRSDNAQTMRPDGTGLGLYLAKKVIVAHHGHIIFKSELGKGSTFGFRIPIK